MPPNQVAPAPVEESGGGDNGALEQQTQEQAVAPTALFSGDSIPAPLQLEMDADGNAVAVETSADGNDVAIDMSNAAAAAVDGGAPSGEVIAPQPVGDGVEGPVAGFSAENAGADAGAGAAGPAFNNKVAPAGVEGVERGAAMPSRADMLANDTVIDVGADAFAANDTAAERKRSSNHDTVIDMGTTDGMGSTWEQAIVPSENALALQDEGGEFGEEEVEEAVAAEIEYIPKAAATQHLQKAVQALKSMRSKTVDAVAGIQSQYVHGTENCRLRREPPCVRPVYHLPQVVLAR